MEWGFGPFIMAQTNYSLNFGKAERAKGVKSREQFKLSAIYTVKRGEDLPWSKLSDEDVEIIRSAAVQRENMRKYIKDNLSNAALARQFGVHIRTIEKIQTFETWRHVK